MRIGGRGPRVLVRDTNARQDHNHRNHEHEHEEVLGSKRRLGAVIERGQGRANPAAVGLDFEIGVLHTSLESKTRAIFRIAALRGLKLEITA